MAGHPLRTQNIDAGDDRVFIDVMENPVKSFDAKGHVVTISYDALHRPTEKRVIGNGLDNLVQKVIYGESHPDSQDKNLRGQVYKTYDEAGCTTVPAYTFKGEVPQSVYRLRALTTGAYDTEANWDVADPDSLLESETFTTNNKYDALGRVIEQEKPDESITVAEFHQSGALNKVKVQLKSETDFTDFVTGISYNAKGQRQRIDYGNGTFTEYEYDDETFRLTALKTTKASNNKLLQDIAYTYDPVGNVTEIEDNSFDSVFTNNQVVEPKCTYEYDALYRLTRATGREHTGLNQNTPQHGDEWFNQHLANINDANALANYTRTYSYDKGNNLTQIQHLASHSTRSFTRNITVESGSNRAVPATMTGPISSYFDPNGNCTELEHIADISWNYRNNISKATIIQRTGSPDDAEYYVYNSAGDRVRKITVANGERIEKIYLGGVEIRRISTLDGSLKKLERFDHHVMDDTSRIAIVNYWAVDVHNRETDGPGDLNRNKIRYQCGNHLGSASLELNEIGELISYEEYFPYGGTSFIVGNSEKEVKLKEYRYTGKERDDATGLYYYGARYYCPWIGRWLSADPAGPVDGWNLYEYVRGNPVGLVDPDGMQADRTAQWRPTDYEVMRMVEERENSVQQTGFSVLETYEENRIELDFTDTFKGKKCVTEIIVPLTNYNQIEFQETIVPEIEVNLEVVFVLPSDRVRGGTTGDGRGVFAVYWHGDLIRTGEVLGRGTNRNRLQRNADTPTGYGTFGNVINTGESNVYGPVFIQLIGTEGERLRAENQGRSGMGLHGGGTPLLRAGENPLSPNQRLVGTHGCLRITNADALFISRIIELDRSHNPYSEQIFSVWDVFQSVEDMPR